jgi:putative transposase
MADTFSQIYIQVVFAVQNRNALINPNWEEELYKYITGIVQNKVTKQNAGQSEQKKIKEIDRK